MTIEVNEVRMAQKQGAFGPFFLCKKCRRMESGFGTVGLINFDVLKPFVDNVRLRLFGIGIVKNTFHR